MTGNQIEVSFLSNNALPLVTAHTGSGLAPANTWPSFMEACSIQTDIAEMDIRVTCKQEPILLHDHSILLDQHGLDELQQLPLRARLGALYTEYELVKLEDVLHEALRRGMRLNLDIKNGQAVNPTLSLVKAVGAEHLVYITGSTEGIEVDATGISLLLNAPMSMIMGAWVDQGEIKSFCKQAREAGYCGINLHEAMVTPSFVEIAHAYNLFVSVYTVNEEGRMRQLMALHVDSITTMKPALLQQLKHAARVRGV